MVKNSGYCWLSCNDPGVICGAGVIGQEVQGLNCRKAGKGWMHEGKEQTSQFQEC